MSVFANADDRDPTTSDVLAEIGAAVSRAMPTREFVLREIGDGVLAVIAETIVRNWPTRAEIVQAIVEHQRREPPTLR